MNLTTYSFKNLLSIQSLCWALQEKKMNKAWFLTLKSSLMEKDTSVNNCKTIYKSYNRDIFSFPGNIITNEVYPRRRSLLMLTLLLKGANKDIFDNCFIVLNLNYSTNLHHYSNQFSKTIKYCFGDILLAMFYYNLYGCNIHEQQLMSITKKRDCRSSPRA